MQHPSSDMPDPPKRARAAACVNCRVRKRRCVPAGNGRGCQLCKSLSTPCPNEPIEATGPSSGPKQTDFRTNRDIYHDLVPLYFRYIHNVAHTMIHEASFRRRLQNGRASMLQVYAMCALAARFSDSSHLQGVARGKRGKMYISEAEHLTQQSLITPSLESVQGLILIGYYYGGEGDTKAKHIYSGLARLHAEALSFPDIPEDVSPMRQEEYRRTWLSVLIASHWTTTDMSIEPVSFIHSPDVILPAVDDVIFHSLDPEKQQENSSLSCNMWAHMAKTLDIFNKTSVILRRLSQCLIHFSDYCIEASKLQAALDQWEQDLPPGLAYNEANIECLVKQGLGRTFLAMHIGPHHFRQMLFFPFLDARGDHGTPELARRAAQCKASANTVSDIIEHSTYMDGCDLNYFIYGHIAVISSCVHLHALLFSGDHVELTKARKRLISNFEYLMDLKSYWPVVEYSVARLRKFQKSCQDSMSDSFVLDNWMVRFLTEHSSNLAERQMPRSKSSGHAAVGLDSLGSFEASYSVETGAGAHGLSDLLQDQQVTSTALVNHAIDWLLE
ncbi:unnamed protein product [Penicillium salamii]|uniref:Zn(2)-C6 fungal-type domain-containing protein n=1 Tax=Penicillium salamii TaxID=1612424 RepID=A0A9W4IRN8_9EURO|nr:unnamed protein product [Penicillium salamii]CAG8133939.1 unnamed protein product [Penicillium salamii]CAG8266229.1 unnamed protein product [Penicillium salamii]CAG8326407.1 unnamed protein product [Penicillium salamii]CAG8350855.1 unnamed protein product [Penicillium salamii]